MTTRMNVWFALFLLALSLALHAYFTHDTNSLILWSLITVLMDNAQAAARAR